MDYPLLDTVLLTFILECINNNNNNNNNNVFNLILNSAFSKSIKGTIAPTIYLG